MSVETKKISYTNIILLRAIAVGFVVYDHVLGLYPDKFFHKTFFPVKFIREYITEPFGIIQDFGWLGVVLFFLISGFLITYVAESETQSEFAIRRIFRIYPPYIVAAIFTILMDWISGKPFLSITDYLNNFTLVSYMVGPQVILLKVAWTLVIEVLFYILVFFIMPVLKRNAALAICIELIVLTFVLLINKTLGPNFFLFSVSFSYLGYLIVGQLIYLFHAQKIGLNVFALLLACSFGFIIFQIVRIYPQFFATDNSYLISFLYAFFLFCIALILRSHITPPKFITFLSNTSYAVYLYHAPIGMFLMLRLASLASSQVVIGLGILGVILISYLVAYLAYRYVELPSIKLGRICADKFTQWKQNRFHKQVESTSL